MGLPEGAGVWREVFLDLRIIELPDSVELRERLIPLNLAQTALPLVFTGRPAFYLLIIKILVVTSYRRTGSLIAPAPAA